MGVDDGHRYRQPDDGWDDDGWDGWDDTVGHAPAHWDGTVDDEVWADTELDGRVRQRLTTLVPLRHEAFDQWDGLRPRMARARRRRHAAQAVASSVLVAAVALVGMQGASRYLPDDGAIVSAADGGTDTSAPAASGPQLVTGEASSTSTGEGASSRGPEVSAAIPTGEAGDDPVDDGTATSEGPASDAVAAEDTSLPPGASGTTATTVTVAGGGTSPATTPPAPAGTAPTVTSPPTFRTTTSASRSTTTRATTTTTRAPTTTTTTAATTVVQIRDLATLDVTVNGSQIRLVTVHPANGVRADVHNSGPEKLEITLTKSGESHEAVVTVRNGNVVTSVVDSSDD